MEVVTAYQLLLTQRTAELGLHGMLGDGVGPDSFGRLVDVVAVGTAEHLATGGEARGHREAGLTRSPASESGDGWWRLPAAPGTDHPKSKKQKG